MGETDTISRQAAIDALDKRFDDVPMELTTEILQLRRDLRERIPSAQPATSCSEIPNSSDTIDRQAALDAIMGQPPEPHYPSWYAAQIEKLPAAQPETNCSEIPNGSDDTISRQAAIDAVIDEFKRSPTPAIRAKLRLEALPSAAPSTAHTTETTAETTAPSTDDWTPCSERLPESDNEVLITVWDAEDDYVEVYKGFYQGHEWWTQWCHGCSKIKDEPCGENIVIAWMPLPEPYKGGEM